MKTSSPPHKKYRCGNVHAALWIDSRIIRGEVVEMPTTKFTKSYIAKDTGDWKYTDVFDAEDLLKVAFLAREVYRDLRLHTEDADQAAPGASPP